MAKKAVSSPIVFSRFRMSNGVYKGPTDFMQWRMQCGRGSRPRQTDRRVIEAERQQQVSSIGIAQSASFFMLRFSSTIYKS